MTGLIIVAAGSGNRMNLGYNKMLYEINGIPLYKHVLNKFYLFNEIVLVINKTDVDKINVPANVKLVIGGETRSESVYNGLKEIKSPNVLIHDGARIYVSEKIINDCLEVAEKGIPFFVGIKSTDTIKRIDSNNRITTLNRDELIVTQTPQGGKTELFLDLYEKHVHETFTDDISLVEKYTDLLIEVVEGDRRNIKITTMEDII